MNLLQKLTQNEIPRLLYISNSGHATLWRWIITLIVSLICWSFLLVLLTALSSPFLAGTSANSQILDNGLESNYQQLYGLVVLGLYIPTLSFSMWIVKAPLRRLINPKGPVSFSRVFLTGLITIGVFLASLAVEFLLGRPIVFQPWDQETAIFAAICVIGVIFQASAEELMFRGVIVQILGKITRSFLILLIVPSLLFWSIHISNPEVAEAGWVLNGFYIIVGLFLTGITLLTGRLEYALGIHIGNNLFTLLFNDNHAYPSMRNAMGLFGMNETFTIYSILHISFLFLIIFLVVLFIGKILLPNKN